MHDQVQHFLDRKEVEERVLNVIKAYGGDKIDGSKVKAGAHFRTDLGLDSLDEVELVMAFEEEFGVEVSDADAEKIHSVTDAVDHISRAPHAR